MFDPMPGVEKSMHIVKQYKMVAREWHKTNTVIDVAGIPIGGSTVQVIAGPGTQAPDWHLTFNGGLIPASGLNDWPDRIPARRREGLCASSNDSNGSCPQRCSPLPRP